MPKGQGKRRHGKVVTAGHHSIVQGQFLLALEAWPRLRVFALVPSRWEATWAEAITE